MANELATAYISLIPTTRGLESNVSKALAGAVPASGKTGRSMGAALGAGLKTTVKGVGVATAAIIGTAVVKGFQRSTQIENAQKKLEGLGHSAGSVSKIMGNALASVKGTAFGMDEAATVSASVVAAGIKPGKDLEKTLRLVADAATIGGSSMGEMGAIFGKVATSNKVQGDVINQLNAQGIPIIQMLAKTMGKTSEEVVSLSRKGKVSFKDFEKAMGGVSGAALASGDTTTGAWKNTMAALSRFGVALLSGIFPSFKTGLGGLTELIDKATVAVEPFAKVIGEKLGGAFTKAITWLSGPGLAKAGIVLGEVSGGLRAFAASWKYNDGEVTSSGFPGFMEKAAYWIHQVWDGLKGLDFSSFDGFVSSLGVAGKPAGDALASIGGSIKTLVPAAQEFIRQLPNMGGAVAKIAAGGIEVLTKVLSFLADHVDTIIKYMPAIVAGFVAWRVGSMALEASQRKLMFTQQLMAPVFLASNILRFASVRAEQQMAIATAQSTVAENTQQATRKRGILALIAQKVATVATTVATKAAALAQRALNLVLRANPIGLVITAIGLLVAGLVWFFTKTKLGQKIVAVAWAGIKVAFKAVIDFWNTKVVPGFKLGWAVTKIIFRALGQWIADIWTGKIRPAFRAVRDFITVTIPRGFRAGRDAVSRAFGAVGDFIGSVWRNGIRKPFSAIRDFITKTLPKAFRTGRDAIGTAFRAIANLARTPINFVINTVYKNGIKGVFDKVSKAVGSKVRLPNVDEIPKFAKGGLHKGGWALVGEEGPELVDMRTPARVYTAAQSKAMMAGGPQMSANALRIAAGSSPAESQLPVGGWFEDAKKNVKTAFGVGKALLGAKAKVTNDFVVGGLAKAATAVLSPLLDQLASNMPSGILGTIGKSAVGKAISMITGFAKKKDDAAATQGAMGSFAGAAYNGPMGSFHRPARGPFTSMFGPRWGGFHSGVDIAGNGPTFAALNGIVERVGWNLTPFLTGIGIFIRHSKNLETYYGHNPPGGVVVRPGQHVKAGQHVGHQGSTGNATGNHLHFGVYRNGRAVNPMTTLFDNGGMLPQGISLVENRTGKPEPLANLDKYGGGSSLSKRTHVTLVINGREFEAYMDERVDNGLEHTARATQGRRR